MRFLRRLLPLVTISTTALLVSGTASAAIVKSPDSSSSGRAAVWDEQAIVESSLDGEGLVFDILDVAGFAGRSSEFDCDGCEVAFSGLHESFSPSGPRGGGGSALGGGYGWMPAPKKAFTSAPTPTSAKTTNDVTPRGVAKKSSSDPVAAPANDAVPEVADVPSFSPTPTGICAALNESCEESTGSSGETAGSESSGSNGGDDSGGASGGAGSVPEPGSMFLLGSGMLGLAAAVRRRLGR